MRVPLIPCGCSQRTGTVRRSMRDLFGELEREHPHLKENLLSAMGNIDPSGCSIRGSWIWRYRSHSQF